MDSWIFKRPPYNPAVVEFPGQKERFDIRIVVRYDKSVINSDLHKLEEITDIIYETRELLETKLKKVFGDDFLFDSESPFLCGPRQSPQGTEEFFIVVGSDFFRKGSK